VAALAEEAAAEAAADGEGEVAHFTLFGAIIRMLFKSCPMTALE